MIALPPAIISRQPRLPQRQIGPDSSTRTWPSSPAVPPLPRYSSPPRMSPAPTPPETMR